MREQGIKDDEDAILFSTEKAFSDIFNDKQAPAPYVTFTLFNFYFIF